MLSFQFPIRPTTNNISFPVYNRINKPFSLSATRCTFQSKIRNSPNDFSVSFIQNSSLLKFRLAAGGSVRVDAQKNDIQLPEGLDQELMPKHVAVIMDGNRRWAKNRGLPVQLGHRAGGKAMKQLALNCRKFGVEVITVFAFSTENWRRPKGEVNFLMSLFEEVIQSDFEELIENDLRLTFVGNRSQLPKSLQNSLSSVEDIAKDNKGTRLVIAMNYSGRYDITEAAKRIASKVRDGFLKVGDINESLFEQHLDTNGINEFPNPDLLIRTSGELRVSNFMLWQLAYTEMLFVDKLFPDFHEEDLVEALRAFQHRERRFGGYARK